MSDYGLRLETEDDDLIVHTRREITESTEQATDISRLKVDTTEELPPKQRDLVDEAAAWVRPSEADPAPAKGDESPQDKSSLSPSPESQTLPTAPAHAQRWPCWPVWLAGLAGVLILATSVVLLFVVYQVVALLMS